MATPGFTAAASLYETRFHYVTVASGSSAGIVPQLSAGGPGFDADWCRYVCTLCVVTFPNVCFGCCWDCFICGIVIITGGEKA